MLTVLGEHHYIYIYIHIRSLQMNNTDIYRLLTLLRVIPTMTCQSVVFMLPWWGVLRFSNLLVGGCVLVLRGSRRGVFRVSAGMLSKVRPCDHLPRKMPRRGNYNVAVAVAVTVGCCCGCWLLVVVVTVVVAAAAVVICCCWFVLGRGMVVGVGVCGRDCVFAL